MKAGEKFKSANEAGKVAYLDSAGGLFNAMIYGNSQRFYQHLRHDGLPRLDAR
ncbi:hypothetical protein ACFYO0_13430 [Streptomyces sp. NPDC006365]|uniref:hypothetical protein n=1 Tax=Streptomyces sp. NPDC006365 TaxID=3364744 RepID=UPI0036C50FE6